MANPAMRHGVALILLVLAVVAAVDLAGCKKSGSEAVASVDGVDITQDAVYNEVPASERDQALFRLVIARLVEKEAQKAGIAVTDADVQSEIEMSFGSMENFQEQMNQSGLDLVSEMARARTGLILVRLATKDVQATDDEIKARFELEKGQYRQPPSVHLREIRVRERSAADDVLRQLKGGADFNQMIMERSLSTQSNGDWGSLNKETLAGIPLRGLSSDAMSAKAGDIIGPYAWPEETGAKDQFSVFKVEERQEGQEPSLDDAQIRALVQRQVEMYSPAAVDPVELQRRLLSSAKIEVLSPDFKSFEQMVAGASAAEAPPVGETPGAPPGASAPPLAADEGN